MPMLKPRTLFYSLTLFAALMVPALAHAQEPPRLRVSVGRATTAGSIDAEPVVVVSVGYRFTDRLVFEVEATGIDAAADRFADVPFMGGGAVPAGIVRLGSIMGDNRRGMFGQVPQRGGVGQPFGGGFGQFQPIGAPFSSGGIRIERDGRTALATFGVRYEFASQVARFLPYVSGGIGMSRTEESLRINVLAAPAIPGRPGTNAAVRPPVGINEKVIHNGLATSAGVGASVRIVGQLSLDIDARYFRLDGERNLGRFGGGLSYRF